MFIWWSLIGVKKFCDDLKSTNAANDKQMSIYLSDKLFYVFKQYRTVQTFSNGAI